ncbi:MAG TPA: MFS transporter [Pseudolabrys sp.]|nr:MFS transporter [Pseudolabrys sp.]
MSTEPSPRIPAVINLLAFIALASALFARAVDPVIPDIAQSLNVAPATAALLSTGYTLPFALIQPVLGALADMMSKTRLIIACMLIVSGASIAGGLVSDFHALFGLRVLAGLAAGGIFPILLAVVGDRIAVKQRQVAIGRILFAAMSGNLLGASGSGLVGDLIGWRSVLIGIGALGLVALGIALPALRDTGEKPGRFDLSTLAPSYRAVFSNPLAKYCFGAVFVEAIFVFGLFPYVAVMLRSEGIGSAAVAGLVIAGFGAGGILYTLGVRWLLAYLGEQRLMALGGTAMAVSFGLIALRLPWPAEFATFVLLGFGMYMLHGCIQVHVTELAPTARATATAAHSSFFFLGQALGPVIYGLGLAHTGVTPVLLTGIVALTVTGWICALRLRRTPIISV